MMAFASHFFVFVLEKHRDVPPSDALAAFETLFAAESQVGPVTPAESARDVVQASIHALAQTMSLEAETKLEEAMMHLILGQARTAFEQGNAIVRTAAEAYMASMKDTVVPNRNTYGRALGAGPSTSRGFDPIEAAHRFARETGQDDGEADLYP